MKKNKYKIIIAKAVLIIIISSSFFGCEKGDEDPVISVISRLARVEGDWRVTHSVFTGESRSSFIAPVFKFTETFDGTTWVSTITSPPSISKGIYTYKFEKDGLYRMHLEQTLSGSGSPTIIDEEGIWDFLAGIGEPKNKEFMKLIPAKITISIAGSGSTQNYDTRNGRAKIWQVKTLKNKKIVVNWKDRNSIGLTGETDDHNTLMTLTQD